MSNEIENKINEAPEEAVGKEVRKVIGAIIELEKASETKELVIRVGKAPDLLPDQRPLKTEIKGTITAPAEFAKHRADIIHPSHSHVIVNENENYIKLVVNETDPNNKIEVTGSLSVHIESKIFKWNNDESYSVDELRDYFKKVRHYFADTQEYVDLMHKLENFSAKIETYVSDIKDDKTGNVHKVLQKKINAEGKDLTHSFKVKVRLYQDVERSLLTVELYPVTTSDQVRFRIACVEVYEEFEKLKYQLFEKTLSEIPKIPVFNI